MTFRITIIYLFLLITINMQGQNMPFPETEGRQMVTNKGSKITTTDCAGSMTPSSNQEDWNVVLKNFSAFHHTSSIPKAEFKALKQAANDVRNQGDKTDKIDRDQSRSATEPPYINRNFRGNTRGSNVPMDNSMAISRNGFIVSAINSNVIFTNPGGTITYSKGFPDFFTLLGLGTRMYDPRILYDVENNRFIFMCLHGSEPGNTFLCVAFSKTEDPNGAWNYYKIDGNPSGDDRWFDYPNIAISKNDFYIAGLMRDIGGDWQYSVLYQIDKNDGFDGKPLTWKYYNDLKDADGKPSFNLVPTPSGWDKLLDPGMFFVSNNANGGNTYNLYYTTSSVKNNPNLVSLQTTGLETSLAPDGRQKSTTNVLNTFDSRIWSALYLNGTIHMGSHVNTSNGDVGLFYGRMRVNDLDLHTNVLSTVGRDYGFPSFTAFGTNETDSDIMINYLVSGPDIFPGQQQRVCTGTQSVFEWSDPVTLKEGASFVNVLDDNNERWGDYTTSCRRFFDGRTETWVTGCFGESLSYGTWLGQFIPSSDFNAKPMAEFTSNLTTIHKDTTILFTDLTSHNPTAWQWTFPGGIPSTASSKNPSVIYKENGIYDVQLIVTNDLGTDTIIKQQYIHIQDPEVKPVADFLVENDTIFVGDQTKFINRSSENSYSYKWTFPSGSPPSSTEKDPVIKYNKAGSFLASLSVINIAGTSSKIIQKAVTVINRTKPSVALTADKKDIAVGESIQFTDLSTGGPTNHAWYFEGGSPEYSTTKDPLITYNTEGNYDVKLLVSNELGIDSTVLIDYIKVGQSSSEDVTYFDDVKLYPNPVTNDEVNISFHNHQTSYFNIKVNDLQGRHIKTLYNDKVKQGNNRLSFTTTNLVAGQYYIVFSTDTKALLTLPFIVVK